jgi:hypothetical protein
MPKLRLAKVKGFEGLKILNIKINRKRAAVGLKPIDLAVYFSDECEFRQADQNDLIMELCRSELIQSKQHNFGGNNYGPPQKFINKKTEEKKARQEKIRTYPYLVP